MTKPTTTERREHPVTKLVTRDGVAMAQAWVGHDWTAWEKPPGGRPFRSCLVCGDVEVKPLLP